MRVIIELIYPYLFSQNLASVNGQNSNDPLAVATWGLLLIAIGIRFRKEIFNWWAETNYRNRIKIHRRNLMIRGKALTSLDLKVPRNGDETTEKVTAFYENLFQTQLTKSATIDWIADKSKGPISLSLRDQERMNDILDLARSMDWLLGMPPPNFKESEEHLKAPEWVTEMNSLIRVLIWQIHFYVQSHDFEIASHLVAVTSTVLDHLVLIPQPKNYDGYLSGMKSLLAQMNKIAEAAANGTTTPSIGLMAVESMLPLRHPSIQFESIFARQIEVIERMPGCKDVLIQQKYDIERVRRSVNQANNVRLKSRALAQAYAGYDYLTSIVNLDAKSGMEQMNITEEAGGLQSQISPKFDDLYFLAAPEYGTKTKSYLTLETKRRAFVTLMRIIAAQRNGSDWNLAVGLDDCLIDPYLNERFDISVLPDQIRIDAKCPDFYEPSTGSKKPVSLRVQFESQQWSSQSE